MTGQMIGVDEYYILRIIGAGLILFSISIVMAIRKLPEIKAVKSIIMQDWAWVIAAIIIISLQIFGMSQQGYWALGLVSIPVAIFAFLQWRYAR